MSGPGLRARVLVPAPLQAYTGGQGTIEGHGATVRELLADLEIRHAGLRFRLIDEQDRIRPHIRIFVGGTVARTLDHAVRPGDQVQIVAALSGG